MNSPVLITRGRYAGSSGLIAGDLDNLGAGRSRTLVKIVDRRGRFMSFRLLSLSSLRKAGEQGALL